MDDFAEVHKLSNQSSLSQQQLAAQEGKMVRAQNLADRVARRYAVFTGEAERGDAGETLPFTSIARAAAVILHLAVHRHLPTLVLPNFWARVPREFVW